MENVEDSICEFEKQKKEFKESIQILIESGMLNEAREAVEEYQKIVNFDIDIYSIKAIISIMEGSYNVASIILEEGLAKDSINFDLLYNSAYLYQTTNQLNLSIEYYIKALQNAKSEEDEDEVYELLKLLGVNESKQQIINSREYDFYYSKASNFESLGNRSDAALYYGIAYRNTNDDVKKNKLLNLYINNESLKHIFDVAASYKNKRFIILSSCGWVDVYQRMHHISRSLAKFGHEVIYITPSVTASVNSVNISVSDLTNYSLENTKVVDEVKIYSPLSAIYDQKQIGNNYINLVQKLLDNTTNSEQTIIITYLPYQVEILKSLTGNFMHIYECVDDHSDIEYAFWGNKNDVIWEQELMDKANFITTTATSLFLQRRAIEKRENVYLSRNAVNEADFIINDYDFEDIPVDLKAITSPRIVYIGALYEWFDTALFYEIVESNPDKSFVIIGFGKDDILKKEYPNLYFLGAKKHSELKKYLSHMDIGIIPFKADTDIIINCDPIKHYEYIACGLPVITTFMPESAMNKKYTYLVNNKDIFNDAIEKCLKLEVKKEETSNFIVENSWNARAALLCRLADNNLAEVDQEKATIYIGQELDKAIKNYDSPIFKTLRAVYGNINDSCEFEKLANDAYLQGVNKYIEKQFLTALLINNKITDFIDVVSKSKYIREELKKEILFCNKDNDRESIECLCYIVISDIKQSLFLIKKLLNRKKGVIYNNYINYLLGKNVNFNELNQINKKDKTPLLNYLTKEFKIENHTNNINGIKIFIADIFNNISKDFVEMLLANDLNIDGFCADETGFSNGLKKVLIEEIVEIQNNCKIKVIVPYNYDYVKQVRTLSEKGIEECEVAITSNGKITFVNIDNMLMNRIKRKEYYKTITFNKFNAADSNVHALIKYIPEEYMKKYNLNIIYGRDVWSIENIVKVPLISNVTVSGFATFLYNYPKLTYNIEVGHGGLQLKACGLMDKGDKNSGGSPAIFENVDMVCVASQLNMVAFSSFYAIPENKYSITGLPRNDLLFLPESRDNLEKLLEIEIGDKKIIFNMPTFHVFDQIGRVEGNIDLNDSFKIENFNYEEFDLFLEENNMLCVSKVHHGEEKSVTDKVKRKKYSNLFFINNDDISKKGLDLYELLGAAYLLITDYSTVYNDFLQMNKPIIFVNTDIKEYREMRGLILEPYDFWTAGPKVKYQNDLQEEIKRYIMDNDYYRNERERLCPVFFKYLDVNSTIRTWKAINESIEKL